MIVSKPQQNIYVFVGRNYKTLTKMIIKKFTNIVLFATLMILFSSCLVLTKRGLVFGESIQIGKETYFDETEMTVMAWLSYYSWIYKNEGQLEAQKVLPDSCALEPDVWQLFKSKKLDYDSTHICIYTNQPIGYFNYQCNDLNYNRKLSPNPNSCPIFYYPITGLTYEQVVNFCKWRTNIFDSKYVTFRLPTEKEWMDFALFVLNETERKNRCRDSVFNQECRSFNYKLTKPCSHLIKEGIKKAQQDGVGRYPNKIEAYDVFGNVSEMTSVNGISKGGNYTTYANKCHLDSIQYYKKPEIWLGFRCIGIMNKK